MTRKLALVSVLVLGISLGIGLALRSSTANPAPISPAKASARVELEQAVLFAQINATDGDANLQLALDGDAWKSLKLVAPGGRKILDVKSKGKLKGVGLTGLTVESDAAGFEEVPLEEFRDTFPAGRYVVRGKTVDGDKLSGTATLTHDFPAGPVVVAPGPDAVVSPDNVVVSWSPVTEPPGIVIVAYQVVASREDPLRVVSIDLPADATSVTLPLLESDAAYTLEVLAQEASGNQTVTQISFRTS